MNGTVHAELVWFCVFFVIMNAIDRLKDLRQSGLRKWFMDDVVIMR